MVKEYNNNRLLPPEELLEGVPYKNQAIQLEEKDGGPVLWAKIRPRWWMKPPFSWIMSYREQKGFRLDPLGFEVWEACDGVRNIEQIVEEFSERHQVSFHEARIVVMQFLRHMTKRDIVAVVFKNRPGEFGV